MQLVREHMFDYRVEWSDAAVRRFVRRVGVELVADLFDLRMADALGNGLKRPDVSKLEALAARVDRVLEQPHVLGLADLAVGGADVMEVLGLAPGPEVGTMLERLLDEVLDEPARNNREGLRARIVALSERDRRP